MIVSSRRLRNVLAYTALVLIGLMRAGVARAQLTGGCTQTDMQKNLGGNYDAFTSGSTGQLGHAGTCQSFYEAGSDFSVCRVFPVYDCYGSDGQFKTTFPNDVLHSDVNKCQSRVTTPLAMCVTRDRTACSVKDLETQINTGLSYSIMFQIMLGVNGSCFDLPTIQNKFGCDLTRSKTRVIVKCDEDQFASFWDDDDAVIVFWVICGWCSLSVLGTTAAFLAAAKKWYVKFAEGRSEGKRHGDFEDAPLLDVQRENIPAKDNNAEEKKTPSCCGSTLWSVLGAFDALQNYRELIDTTERKVPKDPKTGAVREDHDAETNWFDGFRFTAMLAVIYGHWMLLNNGGQSAGYFASLSEFIKSYESIALVPAFLAVDAFFYMSGFLFMYLYIRTKKREDLANESADEGAKFDYLSRHVNDNEPEVSATKQNLLALKKCVVESILLIVHRYLRMTPAIMFVIFIATYLMPYLPQGVLCQTYRGSPVFFSCKQDWWLQMLYVTNLKAEWEFCCAWLWYLSADFQFFVIAVLLAPLYRLNRFVYMALVAAMVFASLVLFGQYQVFDLEQKFYYVSYTRGAPYCTGMLIAALINEPTIRRKVVPSFAFQVIGNMVAVGSFIAAVNLLWYDGTLEMQNKLPDEPMNRFFNASIEALFCIFMSVTTLLWGSGYGGIIFRFFSHAAFRVPSKLTFSAYIIHFILLVVAIANQSYVVEHLDRLAIHTSYGGCVLWIMISAVFVHVLLEAPLTKLNALLTKKRSRK
jgi:peptidoglycan/LPS O-acetylase OafA/YrhL